jgi:hypothetical protein
MVADNLQIEIDVINLGCERSQEHDIIESQDVPDILGLIKKPKKTSVPIMVAHGVQNFGFSEEFLAANVLQTNFDSMRVIG